MTATNDAFSRRSRPPDGGPEREPVLRRAAHRITFGLLAAAGGRTQRAVLRAFFDWKYRLPDPWSCETSAYERYKYERTLDLVPRRRFPRALEIGCGEGVFSALLLAAREVDELVGIDIAARAVARARSRCAGHPAAHFRRADVLEGAPAGPFDLVFATEILYYLGESALRLADTVSALLAPDGRVVLVHPWPEAERLHGRFAARAGLATMAERVEQHPLRPFCISVLAAPGGRGS